MILGLKITNTTNIKKFYEMLDIVLKSHDIKIEDIKKLYIFGFNNCPLIWANRDDIRYKMLPVTMSDSLEKLNIDLYIEWDGEKHSSILKD